MTPPTARPPDRERLLALYTRARTQTESLAARLTPEDQVLQSMPDASPTKWHRAHTTWFFETFVLEPSGIAPVDRRYGYLFNSYYEAVGPRHARPKRGMLSRPTAAEVSEYRKKVDASVTKLLAESDAVALERVAPIVELGVAHEEQHQELLLTDILHAFSESPLRPPFLSGAEKPTAPPSPPAARPLSFVAFEGGLTEIGASSEVAFAFDNEGPRHKVWLEPFALADRLLTVGELKAFIADGGYRKPSLWLAEGFDFVRANDIRAPLYNEYERGALRVFTLAGERVARDDEPITHVSLFEADAIARYLGARLPTEAEWEVAAARSAVQGNFVESRVLCARPAPVATGVTQLYGDAWEWTRSSYEPYPGYEPPAGALGEYNGKFMVSQLVLRGGSCLTPERHVRASYRNFWHAETRFQMAGIRLARDA
jgi:ergothioneine biosynthesis protein EgtB